MIKDKKLGIVMAEDDEEAAWFNISEGIKQEIKALKARNAKAEADLKISAREIDKRFKNGARAAIKSNKLAIKTQKEFLKLAESKLAGL